jgi:hypothetical protein
MSCSGKAFNVRVNLATSHCAAPAAASSAPSWRPRGIVVRGASMCGLAERADHRILPYTVNLALEAWVSVANKSEPLPGCLSHLQGFAI